MLDQTKLSPQSADWQQTLSRGDIVRFRFPRAEDDPRDGGFAKARPSLVLETGCFRDRRFVKLAYGTSADTTANRGYEVRVMHPDAIAAAGLDKPTRFVCARTLIVSLDNPGFEPAETNGIPVIGRLDPDLLERMNAVRARLQAEADIAAEARAERRRNRRVWRREARGLPQRNRAHRGPQKILKKGNDK